jgi:hypothetical protein
MFRKLLVLLTLLCVAATESAAITVTFQQDVNGYTGTEDTQFWSADPFTPVGEDPSIAIDEDDGGGATQGALRFTNIIGNQMGQIPANSTVTFAELQIFVVDPGGATSMINFHRVLGASPWNEESTWETLGGGLVPDETGVVPKPILYNDTEARATPDFTIPNPLADEVPMTFDVTEAVRSWVTGAANLGWAVSQNTGSGWDFSASEEPNENERPKLTVVFTPPGSSPADINGDNVVNMADYTLLLNNMGLHLDGPIVQGANGDLNADRKIDPADFGVFKAAFPGGAGAFEAALAASVPEPSSVVLVLLAACGLAFRRRNRS